MPRKKNRNTAAPGPKLSLEKAPAEVRGGGKYSFLWALSLILIVSGYALLHKADPAGSNSWAVLSPLLLLCGYLLIIPAILLTYNGK